MKMRTNPVLITLKIPPLACPPLEIFFVRPYMLTVKVILLKQHQFPRKISIPLLQEFCKGLAKFCSLISNLSQIAGKFNSEVSYIQTMRYNNKPF